MLRNRFTAQTEQYPWWPEPRENPFEAAVVTGRRKLTADGCRSARATVPLLAPVRRVVTGHDDQGRSIIVSDGPAPHSNAPATVPDLVARVLWIADRIPASNAGNGTRRRPGPSRRSAPGRAARSCASPTSRPTPATTASTSISSSARSAATAAHAAAAQRRRRAAALLVPQDRDARLRDRASRARSGRCWTSASACCAPVTS